MVTLIGFEIEELETNEFPHFRDQADEKYLGVSAAYLKDHDIVVAFSYTTD